MSENAKQSRFEKIIPVPPPKHEIVRDNTTGLEWQAIPFDKRMTWKDADKACRVLRLGGHEDWRLPTRAELLTLVDDTRVSPAIDTDAFPGTPEEWFWTATPYAGNPDTYAWVVYFDGGYSSISNRGYSDRVRAVRGPARQ
jgi:hypothetical protein